MSPRRQIVILAAIGAVASGLWLTGLASRQGGDDDDPQRSGRADAAEARVTAIVEPVRFASDAAILEAVGTGVAVKAVTLHPEAAGQVADVMFHAGQRVSAGAPLLRLDDEEERLALDLAQVRIDDARQKLARYEKVASSGAVSASEVDAARTALSSARIQHAQADLSLRRRTLVAPFDGVVGIPAVEVGDRVTETTEITTLDDRSALLIDFEIPEAYAAAIAEGRMLEATTWALPGQVFTGSVDAMSSRIDQDTRTMRVRARVNNEHDALRPGMSFSIRLEFGGEQYPSVRSVAIQWNRDGAYLWRITDGVADRISVRVLKRSDEWVVVSAPLSAGDQIVIEGVQRLRPGLNVDARKAGESTETKSADGP